MIHILSIMNPFPGGGGYYPLDPPGGFRFENSPNLTLAGSKSQPSGA